MWAVRDSHIFIHEWITRTFAIAGDDDRCVKGPNTALVGGEEESKIPKISQISSTTHYINSYKIFLHCLTWTSDFSEKLSAVEFNICSMTMRALLSLTSRERPTSNINSSIRLNEIKIYHLLGSCLVLRWTSKFRHCTANVDVDEQRFFAIYILQLLEFSTFFFSLTTLSYRTKNTRMLFAVPIISVITFYTFSSFLR